MSCQIYNKRAVQHSILYQQAIALPNDPVTSISLNGKQVNKEELIKVVAQLKQADCAVKGLEFVHANIDQTIAAMLSEGITSENCTIKELVLKNCIIGFNAFYTVMKALQENTSMISLHMESVTIHEKEAQQLAEMLETNKQLCGITLLSCGINDEGLAMIAAGLRKNNKLNYLDLRYNQFQDKGLQCIANCIHETGSCLSLMLDGVEIDEDLSWSILQVLIEDKNCKLSNLSLSAFGSKMDTAFKMTDSLKSLTNLQSLSISKNVCSIQFMSNLAETIKAIQTLTSVNLSQCSITDDIFSEFIINLGFTNLAELDVSRNKLTNTSCSDLRDFLKYSPQLQALFLQNNTLGGDEFSLLAGAIGKHQSLQYLDMSYTGISNDEFIQLFDPISKNKTITQHFECRGNNIGGKALDNVLACVSRTLKVLDLSDNNLTEMNGEILRSYSRTNVWIEAINISDNQMIRGKFAESIKDQCLRNIQIKNFILKKLPLAEDTGFKHKSLCLNCYSEFDVSEITLEGTSFHKLDFLAKFMVQNKESLECLILKDLNLGNGGTYLTHMFKGAARDMKLKKIWLEKINFSLAGLKQLIKSCEQMQHLEEFSLVNIDAVRDKRALEVIETSFGTHRSILKLNLSANNLPNYDSMVQIMQSNDRIQTINVRGSTMNVDNLGYFWLGLRENTSIISLDYQTELLALSAIYTLFMVETELDFNKEINKTILPVVQNSFGRQLTSLDLTGIQIETMESIIKFLRLNTTISDLNLSNSNLNSGKIVKLTKALVNKEIEISTLNLSRNSTMKLRDCVTLKNIFSSNSSVQHLYLDQTPLDEAGVQSLLQGINENMKVHTISFRNCKEIELNDKVAQQEWMQIIYIMNQNCSLTNLDLKGNSKVSDEFLQQVDIDIAKNKLIVDNIFPLIRKQEKQAEEKKKARTKRREIRKQRTLNPRFQRKDKLKRSSSFDKIEVPNKVLYRSKTVRQSKGQISEGDGQAEQQSNVKRNDLSALVDKETKADECLSVQTKHNHLDDMLNEGSEVSLNLESDGEEEEEGFDIKLGDMNIETKDFSFLTKFMSQFKKIKNVDLGKAKVDQKELGQIAKVVQANPYIQDVKMNAGGMSKKAKDLMKAELEKNKEIRRVGAGMEGDEDGTELDLHGKDVNIQAVAKMVKHKSNLEDLDLSGNKLGNHGVKDVAVMIEENQTIKRLMLKNCDIGTKGLQQLVSSLCKDPDETVEYLDLRDNHSIPDKHLKMLLVLVFKNRNIQEIEYSLNEEENQQRKDDYCRMVDKEQMDPLEAQRHLGHGHHDHYHWYDYALVLPWLWKSFVHAKHEAFAFKYDPEVMRLLEENEMRPIRTMMYFWTVMYYIIIFSLPFVFKQQYCGGLFYKELFLCYGTYAFLNAVWEVFVVLRIQAQIRRKFKNPKRAAKLLCFNRWHVVELFMGQIARFDTFLDFMFIVVVMDCPELRIWLILTSGFMIANFIYPTFMLLKKLKMPASHLQHTMPYMEANNFLSFVRENMLLATVVDSFCINNTVSFSKHANKGKGVHVTYGRLMGTLTFFLQDFPQFSIHAYFKVHPLIFAYPAVHYHLKAQTLLLISMIISGMAVCISCFNMIMCVENEFDPVMVEVALRQRRDEKAKQDKAKKEAEEKKQKQSGDVKNALLKKLTLGTGGENQLDNLIKQKEEKKSEVKESVLTSKFMAMNKVHSQKAATLKSEQGITIELAPIAQETGKKTPGQQNTQRSMDDVPDECFTTSKKGEAGEDNKLLPDISPSKAIKTKGQGFKDEVLKTEE